jgi:hypothetical protein
MDPNLPATFILVLLTPAVLILATVTALEVRKYLKSRARRAEPTQAAADRRTVGVAAERRAPDGE